MNDATVYSAKTNVANALDEMQHLGWSIRRQQKDITQTKEELARRPGAKKRQQLLALLPQLEDDLVELQRDMAKLHNTFAEACAAFVALMM